MVSLRKMEPHPSVAVATPFAPRSLLIERSTSARAASRAQRVKAQHRFFAVVAAQQAREARRLVSDHAIDVPAPSPDYTSFADWPLWRCTMLHESGGSWTFETARHAGAFAIARTTWRAYAGVYARSFPNAALAPPAIQILGARLVRDAVGSSEWGGLRSCGG